MPANPPLAPADAWERIAQFVEPLPGEWLPRRETRQRVVATALAATTDVPPLDVSAMDGYALAGEVPPGAVLPVAGTVAAGDPPEARLAAGSALRIMTGAPIPQGADRVVAVELTDGGREQVRIDRPVPAGEAIRRQAEIVRRGQPLFAPGAPVTPGALALLATHGYERVFVHRPPSVAVLATGNEVVMPEATPRPGQLRDSHTDFLLAEMGGLGIAARSLGICRDDPEELAGRIGRGLDHDVLVLCGGVSAGEFDFVERALARAGCATVFDAVAIQPGKPMVFARHRGGIVFGLPGNPASVMVTYWLFVRPALRRLLGFSDGFWQGALAAVLTAPLPGAKARDRFLPAELRFARGQILASPLGAQGSHDLLAYGRGAALVRVRAGAPPAPAGAQCEILPLSEWTAAEPLTD